MAAYLCDEGALDETTHQHQHNAQHCEQLQIARGVLPPVEVAASKGAQSKGTWLPAALDAWAQTCANSMGAAWGALDLHIELQLRSVPRIVGAGMVDLV